MFRRSRKSLLAVSLAAAALIWSAGPTKAYLPSIGPGDFPDYLTTPNWGYSPPLRKFVDGLPGLGVAGMNNLGQYLSVAVPDITTYPGSDYYEITLQEYSEQMHSDLPPTTLRGYIQTNNGTDTSSCDDPTADTTPNPPCTTLDNTVAPDGTQHHLGPVIIAQKNRPVRVKFINDLPTGDGGDLFIPVDTSILGSGPYLIDYDPVTKAPIVPRAGTFSQNRATLHLHGGVTPWISDGTPHQWITPAGDPKAAGYTKGVSSNNVPDMPDPGDGAATFYWSNEQSSRLMFYHDHAWGITRLNVYVGEAAGYLIQDETEQALVDAGIIPVDQIPLVIEDKTFVDNETITTSDPTWRWGTQPWSGSGPMTPVKGDLWWPHIYMSAENPFDITGIAPMGRWAYGPWFWPPVTNIPYPPVANPYYNPNCDVTNPAQNEGNTEGYTTVNGVPYCQPPEVPGTPDPSWGAEAFMDTPVINGTAYPVLNVDPKPYRFRILNAAHDRFFNLQLYVADNNTGQVNCTPAGDCVDNSEIRYVPALDYTDVYTTDPQWPSVGTDSQPDTWAMDGRQGGAPDWNTAGPDWIQIGTEAGFLPQPVVLPNNPITWNTDVTTFNAGNVNGGTVILSPAQRADVIIDFSAFAGKTLILYNDAPAPYPALDPHYDYFTRAQDMTEAGGLPPTPAGIGPNIRTIMQIKVSGNIGDPPVNQFDMAALEEAFNPAGGGPGVFQDGQHPIIVGQSAYNSTYNTEFPSSYPNWGISRIQDNELSYMSPDGTINTTYMQPKAIQDEMGETYDDYGRLSAKLGLEMAFTTAGTQTFVLQNYVDPSTEIERDGEVQIWKITHNGVDTHPLHFHLYDVQLINRVGWDGFIRRPDANELGWQDTVRISPLEDTIVALRPSAPKLTFGIPESIRPLNPAEPFGSTNGFTTLDPLTGQPFNPPTTNQLQNFDWEYVIHCHILSHEEQDMMRTVTFIFDEEIPDPVTGLSVTQVGPTQYDLAWTDPTPANDPATPGNPKNEIGFIIQRAPVGGVFTTIDYALANATSYSDNSTVSGTNYEYRIIAYNAAGESEQSSNPDSVGAFFFAGATNGEWRLDTNSDWLWNDLRFNFGLPTDVPVAGDWNGDSFDEIGWYRDGMWYLDLNGNNVWDGEPDDMIAGPFGGQPGDIPVAGDWDGDGISEIGIYRPSFRRFLLDMNGNGLWDNTPDDARINWGIGSSSVPVVGDWDGTGFDKVGTVRGSSWRLDYNGNGVWDGRGTDVLVRRFGTGTPVAGDWNSDGIDEIASYTDGWWKLDLNGDYMYDGLGADPPAFKYGGINWLPLAGRWHY